MTALHEQQPCWRNSGGCVPRCLCRHSLSARRADHDRRQPRGGGRFGRTERLRPAARVREDPGVTAPSIAAPAPPPAPPSDQSPMAAVPNRRGLCEAPVRAANVQTSPGTRLGTPMPTEQESAQELLRLYRLTADDLRRVRDHGRVVTPRLDRFIELLYDWMRTQPEYEQFFSIP